MRLERIRTARDQRGIASIELPGGALDGRTAREFSVVVTHWREERDIRAVVVTSGSEDFCTGPAADLDVFDIVPDPASALAALRIPVIVVITGQCRSVGLEVALAGDIRIGSADASFALADVADGRFPAWGGTQRLSRVIKPAHAVEMLLLGRELSATRADELGLVHLIAEDPAASVEAIASRLLSCAPLALEYAKEAVHRGAELPLRAGLMLEGDLNHLLAATEDRAEGIRAFFAKRPPDFIGR